MLSVAMLVAVMLSAPILIPMNDSHYVECRYADCLYAVMLSPIILSVFVLCSYYADPHYIILSVVMLGAVIPNVVAPIEGLVGGHTKKYNLLCENYDGYSWRDTNPQS
jgi:hypothetical protein